MSQPLYISCKFFGIELESALIKFAKAGPTPYQPGNMILLCDQENTQGIALKPEKSVKFFLEAGREPIFKLEYFFDWSSSKSNQEKSRFFKDKFTVNLIAFSTILSIEERKSVMRSSLTACFETIRSIAADASISKL